ncbi:MAG: peroxiredoxin-like family protein [Planctomycetota bacterium]
MQHRADPDSITRRLSRRAERAASLAADYATIAALGLAVSASSAAGQNGTSDKAMAEDRPMAATEPGERVLGEQLDAMKNSFAQRAPQETIDLFEQGIRDVEAIGVLDTAKKVGDRAPGFELPNAMGDSVSLDAVLAEGSAVVTFYRGSWCPYCNIQLRSYQEHLDTFADLGAQLIAISPETPDVTADSEEAAGYEFHVLSDPGNEAADAFGIRYRLPDELISAFEGRLNLAERNGDGSWTLPLGATYVINPQGEIIYAFLDADYRTRAEPADIIAALRSADRPG